MEKKYENFINGVELEEIILSSAQFKRFGAPDPEKYPDIKINFSPGKHTYRQKGNCLSVAQKFLFSLEEFKEEEKSHKLFELKGEYNLQYAIETPVGDELLEMFVNRNIPVNLYPYIRELVQNSMARVGLPPFSLPVLKIKR